MLQDKTVPTSLCSSSKEHPPQPAAMVPAAKVTESPKSSFSNEQNSPETPEALKKTHKPFTNLHHSKYRHLTGTPLHRSQYIENIRNLNTSMFGECDGFQVNSKRAALPIAGPGGKIAVLEVREYISGPGCIDNFIRGFS